MILCYLISILLYYITIDKKNSIEITLLYYIRTHGPLKFDNQYYKHLIEFEWKKKAWHAREEYRYRETFSSI